MVRRLLVVMLQPLERILAGRIPQSDWRRSQDRETGSSVSVVAPDEVTLKTPVLEFATKPPPKKTGFCGLEFA